MLNIHNDVMMYLTICYSLQLASSASSWVSPSWQWFSSLLSLPLSPPAPPSPLTPLTSSSSYSVQLPPALPLHTWREQQINSAIIHLVQTAAVYWICCAAANQPAMGFYCCNHIAVAGWQPESDAHLLIDQVIWIQFSATAAHLLMRTPKSR